MRTTDFIADFVRRYNCNPEEVQIFFSGIGLDLLGGFPAELSGEDLSVSLSAGTYAAIRQTNQGRICIEESASNLSYVANLNTLSLYQEKNWAKPIFHALSTLHTATTPTIGAEILLHYDLENSRFHQPISAVISAVNQSQTPPEQLFRYCKPDINRSAGSILASLCGKANTLLLSPAQRTDLSFLSFPITEYKIILATTKESPKKTPASFFLATWNTLREKNPCLTSVSALTEHDLASLSGNPHAPYAKFIFEEQQRILHTETELRKRHPDWNVLWSIFKASGNGMYTLYHKNAKESCLLHTLATQSGLCNACRLLNGGSGIYVLVKNDMVDALLSGLQAGFLEKAGYSPDFSVCDTATSGFCPPPPKPRPQ